MMVGVRGFEPPASASRTRRSTRLSYTPIAESSGAVDVSGADEDAANAAGAILWQRLAFVRRLS